MASRKTFLLGTFLTGCMVSFAQSGFLFQPQIGFGISKMTGIDYPSTRCNCGLEIPAQKPVFTFSFEAKVGYSFNNLRFNTGLLFIRTGAMQSPYFQYGTGTTTGSDIYAHYDHLLVPVSLGYKIHLKNKWSLTPELGSQLIFLKENNLPFANSGGFLLSGKLNFEKEIAKNLSFVISPAYYNIVTPVYYFSLDNLPLYRANNSVFILQGGLLWHFPRKAKTKTGKDKLKTSAGKY